MRRASAALAALALAACRPAPAAGEHPTVMLLTSLPILFGEEFGLEAPDSPLRDALEREFKVVPIAIADAPSLGPDGGLLLMAQPRAQTAEALVDLDAWVRRGGRLLLLADPLLDWPTSRPLGDPSAPMLAFADTGLLRHWGLTLYRPDQGAGAGSFDVARGSGCALDPGASVARCRIGKGRATIIADADFVRDGAGARRVVDELGRLSGGR